LGGSVRFEALTAPRLVLVGSTDNNEFIAFDQTLSVNGWITATHTNCQQLCNFLGVREQAGHGFERAASKIGIQTGDNDPFA